MSSSIPQPRPGPTPFLSVPNGSGQTSHTSSETSVQRVKNLPGYTTPVFKGKEEQRAKVQAAVAGKVGTY